jgi:transposase
MKRYTQEFKDSTIQLVLNSNESTKKIAEDLNVHEKTLYAWVRAYKEANGMEVPKQGKGKRSSIIKESESEELKRLRKELKLVQQERDILQALKRSAINH